MLTSSVEERFWSKVEKGGDDECWIWKGAKLKGYGLFRFRGPLSRAHRVAHELANGPIPEGKHCLHSCDNPSCVNPRHLRLGSHQDNMNDREARGRGVRLRGESHGSSKLTKDEVRAIRRLYRTGNYTQRKLARQFEVSQFAIQCVVNKLLWKHLL